MIPTTMHRRTTESGCTYAVLVREGDKRQMRIDGAGLARLERILAHLPVHLHDHIVSGFRDLHARRLDAAS